MQKEASGVPWNAANSAISGMKSGMLGSILKQQKEVETLISRCNSRVESAQATLKTKTNTVEKDIATRLRNNYIDYHNKKITYLEYSKKKKELETERSTSLAEANRIANKVISDATIDCLSRTTAEKYGFRQEIVAILDKYDAAIPSLVTEKPK